MEIRKIIYFIICYFLAFSICALVINLAYYKFNVDGNNLKLISIIIALIIGYPLPYVYNKLINK